jgi:oxygen-independent coproporphyrinogen-3 oxidase
VAAGHVEIGIDHFALPTDGLARAQTAGTLKRNFQGYTDDQAEVLIGLGASSISKFPQGYAQNNPATGAYTGAIQDGAFATARGHRFSDDDKLRARLIEALMCDFRIDRAEILMAFCVAATELDKMLSAVAEQFAGAVALTAQGLEIPPHARALTRVIARAFDAYDLSKAGHSSAI